MAEQRSSRNKTEPWLMDRIIGLVKQSDKPGKSPSPSRKLKKIAREKLLSASEGDQKIFERFENNHPYFFQKPFQLEIFDPTSSVILEKEETKPAEEGIAGIARITSSGIAIWVREDLQEKGVVFGLFKTNEKDQMELRQIHTETENRLKSPISTILQSIVEDTLILGVPDGVDANGLFKLKIDCSAPDQIVPIHLIANIGRSSNARLMVDYQSSQDRESRSIVMLQSDLYVGENSGLYVFHHQDAPQKSLVLVDEKVIQKAHSSTEIFNLDTGAAGLEREFSVDLHGEGAESIVTGVYRPGIDCRYYFDTEQVHNASYSVSDLQYNGVLGEHAYTSWKGNIVVKKKTNGTNGYQSNNNLILDETAKVESVPGLEILTDDVRCSHGVTIGNIDKNHMFYLQSRGINKEDAESLIIDGFLRSSIKRIKSSSLLKLISQLF